MIKRMEEIEEYLDTSSKRTIGIAVAEDQDTMDIVSELCRRGIARFVLVGDEEKIYDLMEKNQISVDMVEVEDCKNHAEAAAMTVSMVRSGRCNLIMKGNLHTSVFLRAILDKESGLLHGRMLSQITVYNRLDKERLQLMTDCAMAIEPSLEEKKAIIDNAVQLMNRLGYECPKVAVISALELVNSKIKDTVDAAVLSKMCDRGQIKNCIVDGPLALDNALSKEAASHKGICSPVAGDADILVFPNLQVGNSVFKSLVYFGKIPSAAVIMGADAPVVMTSRTDTVNNKIDSILFAIYLS